LLIPCVSFSSKSIVYESACTRISETEVLDNKRITLLAAVRFMHG
jgi:hypothetical protein